MPIRGINLGGWLVTEPFIVPSLYDQFPASAGVVDEWTLCERLGQAEARRQLEEHYATFITEDDFARIASMGFNHVRIPTGHWAIAPVAGEPFVAHVSWQYLLRAIQWARKYGLRVMIDLHTAPGSQNGWNHSGRTGQIRWLNGTDGSENARKTLEAAQRMAQFFSDPAWKDVVPIFGVLNEPAIYHIRIDKVLDWYRLSHQAIRNASHLGGPFLAYHDGFLGLEPWHGFFSNKSIYDQTHIYLIFDENLVRMPRDKQAQLPCSAWRRMLKNATRIASAPTLVGEFSAATNDCGKYVNGIGMGTRYEGTLLSTPMSMTPTCMNCSCAHLENFALWDDGYKAFLRSFVEHQMDAFESSSVGWFFWTYKTENHVNPHWDYLLAWEQGWAPRDVNVRSYFCGDGDPDEQ
ncbi:glycoside hydrolase superfamily [Dichotomocladium elegans]|nr:glycoside hydrolase superfamily [Dichotomocladium elegans]